MKMNQVWKIVVGLASLWIVVYPFVVFGGMVALIPSIALVENGGSSDSIFALAFGFFMLIMVFSSFLQMAVSAFYLVHVIKNKNGLDILRIILGIGVFYLPYIALPVYYFVYIWPETPPDWALERAIP